jgi:tRNA (adenine22-N1)-methyltransferase
MIKISKRLEAISSLVPINSKVIDIGCDHALLDIYMYQKKIANKIIATDINKNALTNAKENIKNAKLDKFIETRLGNGLEPLNNKDDINTIIISGVGAHTVNGILKNNQSKLKNITTIIIQSNTKLSFLRKEITKLNYKIADELMIEDNKKIYVIIKFIKGKEHYSKKKLYFGPILLMKHDEVFKKYYGEELKKLNIYLELLPKNKLIDRYKIKKEIRLYNNVIE